MDQPHGWAKDKYTRWLHLNNKDPTLRKQFIDWWRSRRSLVTGASFCPCEHHTQNAIQTGNEYAFRRNYHDPNIGSLATGRYSSTGQRSPEVWSNDWLRFFWLLLTNWIHRYGFHGDAILDTIVWLGRLWLHQFCRNHGQHPCFCLYTNLYWLPCPRIFALYR